MKKIIVIASCFLIICCSKKETEKPQATLEEEVQAVEIFLPDIDSVGYKEEPIPIDSPLINAVAKYEEKVNTTINKVVYGKLNHDSLLDAVVVLQYRDKEENPEKEVVLVFLKNHYRGYDLLAANQAIISKPHFRKKYIFDENNGKNITIENHKLKIELFCTGGCNNTNLEFCYKDDKLALKELTYFASGAGSQTDLTYNAKSDTITTSVTNTMEENMPVEETKRKLNYMKPLEFAAFDINDFNKSAFE